MDENNRPADEVEKRDASSVPENGTPSSEGAGRAAARRKGTIRTAMFRKKSSVR